MAREVHNFPFSRQSEDKPRGAANWAIVGIFLILGFAAVAAARDFLMPVTLALLLFFVFTPLRRFAQRRGIPDGATAAIITLGMLATVAAIAYGASGPVNRAAENIPMIRGQLEQKFDTVRDSIRRVQEAAESIEGAQIAPAATVATGETQVITVEQKQESTLESVVKWTPTLISQVVFMLFLLFFMIASGDLLYLKIVQSFDTMRDKRSAYLALREIEDSLGNYLSAITIINACLGLAVGLTMWAWGMPAPFLFGIGAFLLNFIPYLGSITGVILSTIVALVIMPDVFTPLMVGGSYMVLTALEGQLITPYFVSRRLQMNTVVVFLAVALWAWLWSVLGMVIAVPVLVVLRVLAEHIPGWQKFGNFLAGEDPPALEDEDEEEARDLVEAGTDAGDADDARVATEGLSGPEPVRG